VVLVCTQPVAGLQLSIVQASLSWHASEWATKTQSPVVGVQLSVVHETPSLQMTPTHSHASPIPSPSPSA
jgi:hypothetical protein